MVFELSKCIYILNTSRQVFLNQAGFFNLLLIIWMELNHATAPGSIIWVYATQTIL